MTTRRTGQERQRRRELSDAASGTTPPRLLPWLTEEGKPCYLASDGTGLLSRLADDMESVQLGMGQGALKQAREMLGAERDGRDLSDRELRWLASRLAECLADALRVAESRGLRLPVAAPDSEEGIL